MKPFLAPHFSLILLLFICTTPVHTQQLLNPAVHPKFIVSLPNPAKIDATAGGNFEITMAQTEQWLGLIDQSDDTLRTTVWGYGMPGSVTFPGPTIEAWQSVPVDIRWTNNLPAQHLLPVDTTVHLAKPKLGGIPAVVHLHGGHNESASDGLPEAWYTQNFQEKGSAFVKETYHYPMDNEAATLWYHDHALGITRLNTYAGLAGFFLMRDDNEENLRLTNVLPDKSYEQEIVFQDRMFDTDGNLFFPSAPEQVGWPDPSALPEFFGDFIITNGVSWPYMEVEPRKYRLRFLNGSDSRFYIIRFGDQKGFWQIGTDAGLLESPVELTELLLGPGERAEVIFDFSSVTPGTEILVTNRGPDEPFRGLNNDGSLADGEGGELEPADSLSTGRLMKFIVNQPLSNIPDATITTSTNLRPEIQLYDTAGVMVRKLVLFEGEDAFGRLRPQLGILDPSSPLNGSLLWDDETTEIISLDDVEIWEIYNGTEDAHPIHLHLVSYLILNRQEFDGDVEHVGTDHEGGTKLELEFEYFTDGPKQPASNEKGWKDTAIMLPRQTTRIVAKFDRAGEYVWHCHILSHEDHEMMRRFEVKEVSAVPHSEIPELLSINKASPNPLSGYTQIDFALLESSRIYMDIYNQEGLKILTLAQGLYPAGQHSLTWNGSDQFQRHVTQGIYYCQLRSETQTSGIKLVVLPN